MEKLQLLESLARDLAERISSPEYKFLRICESSKEDINFLSSSVHGARSSMAMKFNLLDVEISENIDFEQLCRMTNSQNGRIVLCLKDYQNKLGFVPGMYEIAIDDYLRHYLKPDSKLSELKK